jgi:hypothetical protein
MGSIAYVADQEMIEYHRLCGNKEINFWRLTSQKSFSNFHKGDLLFFYTRVEYLNKKAFVGYAHFDSIHKLSIQEMWKKYGTINGYDSINKLSEAISKACRDKDMPKKMDCLYLKDVVFFSEPVLPEEVGLELSSKLESYCYIDKNDPDVTIRILQNAELKGIDAWSSIWSKETEEVFKLDEIRQGLCSIYKQIGKYDLTESERKKVIKNVSNFVKENNYEYIIGSQTDVFTIQNGHIIIALPFIYLSKNRNARKVSLVGRMALYKYYIKKEGIPITSIKFNIIGAEEDILLLQEEFKYERL